MKKITIYLGIIFWLNQGVFAQNAIPVKETYKIAFGSCSSQDKPQPLWKNVRQANPDLWIWLGDIVYGDTEDMTVLKNKYDKQKKHPDYQTIISQSEVIGIWDDHDYGVNDGGKEYPKREESQQVLFDFLDVSADSPLRSQKGAYSSHTFEVGTKKIKVILLDARYHRDQLERPDGVYKPNETGDILGEEQWDWLEDELKNSEADLNIIGSGIQIIPEQHKYEKWANFPAARKRFLSLLNKTKVKNPLLISGDRHMSEVSRYQNKKFKNGIYEVTSSGLTNSWSSYKEEANKWRVGRIVAQINFGVFDITFKEKSVEVKASIIGENDEILLEQEIIFE